MTRLTPLVLSLFPGADLFGRAFEAEGFCVVRGPDVLWGGDVRDFRAPPGRFDGIIGGPPCQTFSSAAFTGTGAVNLIPEFLRIVEEAQPTWAVMENVPGVEAHAPAWEYTRLSDWDCGGNTQRTRLFYFYGLPPAPAPEARPGRGEYSVIATNWKRRTPRQRFVGHEELSAQDAARLQGFPEFANDMRAAWPAELSRRAHQVMCVHLLGNGVPLAMGRYVAQHVRACLEGRYSPVAGLPLFTEAGL